MMTLSEDGIEFIKRLEAFVSTPYLDSAGVPTIGYGSTCYANGVKVCMSDPKITKLEAHNIMRAHINKLEKELFKLISFDTPLCQNQWDAIISFAYNIGINAFKSSTLLKKIISFANPIDVGNEFLRWVYITTQNGIKIKSNGLKNRRAKEYDLYVKGIYENVQR